MTDATISIRDERPEDVAGVRAVNAAAFPTAMEADAVDQVRAAGRASISLVAECDGEVVGHILFSPVTVDGAASELLGLAPMAVAPSHQRRGIGSRLVVAGLAACREHGVPAAVVLGHTEFYPRFGFLPAPALGLQMQGYPDCEAFFAIEISSGALDRHRGEVSYDPAFDE